jgi:ribosomal protein S18 acetylase RimI-like enzyme
MLTICHNGSIEEVLDLIFEIPEFEDIHQEKDFKKRFSGKKYLILIAYWNGRRAGFNVGYDRFGDGSFYCWLQAVLPEYRRKFIADRLTRELEIWAKEKGFRKIIVKTRNKFPNMLRLLIKNNYSIIEIEKKDNIRENRIVLEKAF